MRSLCFCCSQYQTLVEHFQLFSQELDCYLGCSVLGFSIAESICSHAGAKGGLPSVWDITPPDGKQVEPCARFWQACKTPTAVLYRSVQSVTRSYLLLLVLMQCMQLHGCFAHVPGP